MLSQMTFHHLSVKPGECIKVKGKVAPDAKSLGDARTIVCNSREGGEWGSELREPEFPFQEGEDTKICVYFDVDHVTVKINGDHEIKFPNRLGRDSAEYFSVEGDFTIKSVKFD
uniref:Galectin n=1 Tax=Pogona vitticeps TaxID=103695 RepID=A0ABM5FIE5_9SAUR